MNNYLIYKTTILLVILMFCTACSKSNKIKFISSTAQEEYEIHYNTDSIKIIFKQLGINQIDTAIYVRLNNNFYEINDDDDRKLFFSINKDTLYSENDGSNLYKTEIKKNDESSFKTSTILVNNFDKEIVLSTFYYDKDYKILRIEKQDKVIFMPE